MGVRGNSAGDAPFTDLQDHSEDVAAGTCRKNASGVGSGLEFEVVVEVMVEVGG